MPDRRQLINDRDIVTRDITQNGGLLLYTVHGVAKADVIVGSDRRCSIINESIIDCSEKVETIINLAG